MLTNHIHENSTLRKLELLREFEFIYLRVKSRRRQKWRNVQISRGILHLDLIWIANLLMVICSRRRQRSVPIFSFNVTQNAHRNIMKNNFKKWHRSSPAIIPKRRSLDFVFMMREICTILVKMMQSMPFLADWNKKWFITPYRYVICRCYS